MSNYSQHASGSRAKTSEAVTERLSTSVFDVAIKHSAHLIMESYLRFGRLATIGSLHGDHEKSTGRFLVVIKVSDFSFGIGAVRITRSKTHDRIRTINRAH